MYILDILELIIFRRRELNIILDNIMIMRVGEKRFELIDMIICLLNKWLRGGLHLLSRPVYTMRSYR